MKIDDKITLQIDTRHLCACMVIRSNKYGYVHIFLSFLANPILPSHPLHSSFLVLVDQEIEKYLDETNLLNPNPAGLPNALYNLTLSDVKY